MKLFSLRWKIIAQLKARLSVVKVRTGILKLQAADLAPQSLCPRKGRQSAAVIIKISPTLTTERLEVLLKENRVAARYGLNSADLNLENTLQAVKLQATTYYYRVLQTKNYIEVGEENVRTLQEHLNNVNAQFRAGTVAKADVLSSEVNLANAQQNLVTYNNNYDIAVATLNNYLLLPADTILRTQDQLTYTKYNLNLEDCTAYALENRPDVAAADYAVKQAESQRRSAKAGKQPTVNAIASTGINGEDPFRNDKSDSWTAGISANWNIFDNGLVDSLGRRGNSSGKGNCGDYSRTSST